MIDGQIVVAWHDDLGSRQRHEELTRLTVLSSPSALGNIAGDDDKIWPNLVDGADKRPDEAFIDSAKVNIRQMDYRAHADYLINILAALNPVGTSRARVRKFASLTESHPPNPTSANADNSGPESTRNS